MVMIYRLPRRCLVLILCIRLDISDEKVGSVIKYSVAILQSSSAA